MKKILMAFTGGLFQTILFAQISEKDISQKADALVVDAYEKGIFSGAVVITHNSKKIFSKEIGFADWQAKRVVDKNTLFNIGSLNKSLHKKSSASWSLKINCHTMIN